MQKNFHLYIPPSSLSAVHGDATAKCHDSA